MRTKAIRLLIEDALPEDVRGSLTTLDAGGMGEVLAELARKHPDKYPEVSKRLSDIGRNASYWQGETLSLKDARPVIDKQRLLGEMDKELAAAKAKYAQDPEEFARTRLDIWNKFSDRIQKETTGAALAQGNALGYSVASGARGKPAQLKAMLTTPALYSGSKDSVIPLFVRNGFNNGLRPAEWLAGTYGTRESIVAIKTATAKGGYLGKLMAQATAPVVVSMKDCGADNGIDVSTEDGSLKRRVLAREVGGFPAGTVVDRQVMSSLRKTNKDGYAIVRSPLTCQAPFGVCSKCAGADAKGHLPPIGEAVGITAANAIGEPIAQGSLSSKHTAGQTQGKREYSGFGVVNQFTETPEVFPDRAVVSEKDGKVTKIEPAPQGGTFVYVGEEPHYVLPGYALAHKIGDHVEAGDQLADGLGDPSDVVRLKGLGAGRRYYAERLKKILDDSGMPADPINTELLARAAIDHINVDDDQGLDGTLPDDTVSYSKIRQLYTPPEDTVDTTPDDAVGKYLQRDALQYTIGTKLTPSMASHLQSRGFGQVAVSAKPPPFTPHMVRLQSSTYNNPDWLAAQHTSYLRRQLAEDAASGRTTNVEHNPHFAPRLAIGENFGEHVDEDGEF